MPLLMETAPATPAVTVRASWAVEMEWVLATTQRPDWARDHSGLSAILAAEPAVVDKVSRLWPEEDLALSCGGNLELMALAHQGGLLFSSDAQELLAALDLLARHSRPAPPMGSETEADLRVLDGRLRALRDSSRRRRDYVRTMHEVWEVVGPLWEETGRGQVDQAVARRRRLVESGRTWIEILGEDLPAHRDELTRLVEAMAPSDELVIVPAFFAHLGLIIDLPGNVVAGVRVSPADPRMATEGLARRLRAVADPTRLAIVALLAGRSHTVTELAAHFEVAQPTMSNHIKVLRDAGLVTSQPLAGRRQLSLSPGAAQEVLAELAQVLAR